MYIYFWIFILFASIIVELITATALVSIWFAVGALASLLLSYLNVSFIIQSITFFVVSLATIVLIRPLAIKNKRGNTIPTNNDRFIGRQTKLLKSIKNDEWGELKIDGTIWHATSYNSSAIDEGSLVEVLAIEGSKLIVKQIQGGFDNV